MSEAKSTPKSGRKVRTLEEEIAAQREKLRKLEERQRKQKRKEQERNTKTILELIRNEKLDVLPAEQWKAAMPSIKAALLANSSPQLQVETTDPKNASLADLEAIGQ